MHVTANCGNTLLAAGVLVHLVCMSQYDWVLVVIVRVFSCLSVAECAWRFLFFFEGTGNFLKTIFHWVEKASSFASFGLCLGLCGLQMCLLLAWALFQ